MKKKIKVGVIGVGGISGNHINAYLKNPNVELYAFCDINENQLKKMGKEYGIERLFTDKDEMLKLKEIDAVSVCTWNNAHAECSIAALNAGKHVLCEKPMAMNQQEAEAMKAAAEKNGKLLMIGFVRRHGNDCKILNDFINAGTFGDFYYAKATYLRRNGNPGGWFGDKSRSGGGPLIDLGVHVIDLVRFIMGNPKPISVYGATFKKLLNRPDIKKRPDIYVASSSTAEDICDVEDFASALIRFDNGAVLSVETSFSLNIKKDKRTLELFGTNGGATFNPDLEIYTQANKYLADINIDYPTSIPFDVLFENEINHYVDCIVNGAECIAPADDGIVLMSILDAIYESGKTGHEIII